MNELNRLPIKNSESNTEHGFYFVEFENGNSLQCCLVSSKKNDFEEQYFHNQIEMGNSGYSEGPFYRDWETDRKSTRLNSSHSAKSRMPSSA